MKDYVIDVLMNIGVPAGIKGFTYICVAAQAAAPFANLGADIQLYMQFFPTGFT